MKSSLMIYMKFAFVSMIISLVLGCSSGKVPILPDANSSDLPVGKYIATGEAGGSGTAPMGVFRGFINAETLAAELEPSRNSAAIGDVFDADITQFLMSSPCWNCARIDSVDSISNDILSIGIAIKHPITNLNQRPDLHVFDVRGIMLLPTDTVFGIGYPPSDGSPIQSVSGNAFTVTNADGMTTHFDELASNTKYFDPPIDIPGNLNPYKNYFIDEGTGAFDPFNPTGHNVFQAGATWETQTFTLDMSSVVNYLEFVFIIDASYGQSAVFANRQNPQYYLPQFNRKEAWRVNVGIISNALEAVNTASSMEISIEVYDWQGNRTIDPSYPDPTHLTGIPYESDVKNLKISVPALFNGEKTLDTPSSGTGAVGDPYRYSLVFNNELNAGLGKYAGLVCVRDDLWGTNGPYGIPQSPKGFPFAGPDIKDYAAYKCFTFTINDPWDLKPDPFPGDIHCNFGYGLAVGDFNGDSIYDLAIGANGAEPSGSVIVYFGDGEKLVEPPLVLNTDGYEYDSIGYRVAVGKINDDAFDDIVTNSDEGAMVVFLSDGVGGFQPAIKRNDPTEMMSGYGVSLEIGNVINNNYGEIVTSEGYFDYEGEINSGRVLVYTFDGSSLPAPIQFSNNPTTNNLKYGLRVALAKINGDDIDDLLVFYDKEVIPGQYYDIQMIKSDGAGGFYDPVSFRETFPSLNSVYLGWGMSVTDLNNDGLQEWVIGAEMNTVNSVNSAGEFFIFYADGNGGFNGYTRHHSGELYANERMGENPFTFGDFNGDSYTDILLGAPMANGSDGSAHLFMAKPGGYEFSRRFVEPPLDVAHYYLFGFATAAMDIDGNGDDELLISSDSENWIGHVYIYFNP